MQKGLINKNDEEFDLDNLGDSLINGLNEIIAYKQGKIALLDADKLEVKMKHSIKVHEAMTQAFKELLALIPEKISDKLKIISKDAVFCENIPIFLQSLDEFEKKSQKSNFVVW